jgi:succinate dehydrogenase (ubiquinone) flavoprotein subunit
MMLKQLKKKQNLFVKNFSLTKKSLSIVSKNTPEVGKSQGQLSKAYPIVDHTYDAIVVGAGGAGLTTLPIWQKLVTKLLVFQNYFQHVLIQ